MLYVVSRDLFEDPGIGDSFPLHEITIELPRGQRSAIMAAYERCGLAVLIAAAADRLQTFLVITEVRED